MTSEATEHARRFVAEHLPQARGLGQALAELIDDPESFVAVLGDGLEQLADEAYAAEQDRVSPGAGPFLGVRWPLIDAVAGQLRRPLAESPPASALWLAQRLAMSDERELRLFSHVPLRRALAGDHERSWQLMRRLARAANDWISTDSLADLFAQGVLLERFRWAELEQLVYSPHRWERRLVGATVARLPYQLPPHERAMLSRLDALALLRSLLGDSDEQVQKALAWALREWTKIDPQGVERLLDEEAALAADTDDGHRASVVRDALPAQRPAVATRLRQTLERVRRRPDAPSTSAAAAVVSAFRGGAMAEMSERASSIQGERQALGRRVR